MIAGQFRQIDGFSARRAIITFCTLILTLCVLPKSNQHVVFAQDTNEGQGTKQSSNDDQELIEKYLRNLDSPDFSKRQEAMVELASLGGSVIGPLSNRALTSSVEFQNRAMSVLHRLAIVSELATSTKAIDAIRDLADSDSRSVAARAAKALDELKPLILERLVEKLSGKNVAFYRDPYLSRTGEMPVTGIAFGPQWECNKKDLVDIASFTNLRAVTIDNAKFDNEDFSVLIKNEGLQKIAVRQAEIDNRALENISSLPNLQRLDIYYCDVNDEGIKHLMKCKNLASLKLIGTSVSDKGAQEIQTGRLEEFLDYRKGGYLGVRYNRGSETALLTAIEPNSAAEKAGLKENDTIISYNGNKIDKPEDLSKFISPASIKDDAKIVVKRDGKELEFNVNLGRWDIPDLSEFVNQLR